MRPARMRCEQGRVGSGARQADHDPLAEELRGRDPCGALGAAVPVAAAAGPPRVANGGRSRRGMPRGHDAEPSGYEREASEERASRQRGYPMTPWARQSSTTWSSRSEAWFGYKQRAADHLGALAPVPSIWASCAAPGVGWKDTRRPRRRACRSESRWCPISVTAQVVRLRRQCTCLVRGSSITPRARQRLPEALTDPAIGLAEFPHAARASAASAHGHRELRGGHAARG